ncbi:MAG: hypothetical protein ACOVP2_01955, partial [Armatimonadaceae bacterium]
MRAQVHTYPKNIYVTSRTTFSHPMSLKQKNVRTYYGPHVCFLLDSANQLLVDTDDVLKLLLG